MRRPISPKMLGILAICLSLWGCGSPPVVDGPPLAGPTNFDHLADAQVRHEPIVRAGNPESYEVFGQRYRVMDSADGYRERGYASWYGRKFHGRKTSNGETYDMYKMTAAHKTLPIPSYVRVTNLENDRQVVLRVNDRGPFKKGRIIDLSYAAASKLDMLQKGTALVEVEVLTPGSEVANQPSPARLAAPISAVRFLQTGAFKSRTNALSMEQRLLKSGFPAQNIHVLHVAPFYRVRLGPYADEEQLAHDMRRLNALGIIPRTVQELSSAQ